MGKLFTVIKYIKGYWKYARLNIFFNILFSLLAVVSITLVIPFIQLLDKPDEYFREVMSHTIPEFSVKTIGKFLSQYFEIKFSGLIATYGKSSVLVMICITVFVLTFFKNLCRYMAMYFLAPIRNGVVRDLRNKMFGKALDLPLAHYSDERKGDIISRMTTDVVEIEWSIMLTLELIFREPLSIIISLTIMFLISTPLTLYIFLLLPIAGLVIALISRGLKKQSARSRELLGHLFNMIEETLGGLKIIKAFTGEKFIADRFKKTNEDFYRQSVKVYRRTDLASPVSESLVVGILMIILFLGGNMVITGEGLSAAGFVGYFGIASQLLPPIKQITIAYNSITRGLASEDRINRILDAEISITEKANAGEIKEFNEKIEFKKVSFAYRKGDTGYVLKDIDLVIPKGKTIALVGQSGSGKTTLADMVPRFYDVDGGELLIDGKNIKDLKIKSLRGIIGMVSQESILFNDTVFNNISFGITSSMEEVERAAKIANAHEFIVGLPEGYDTNIGDRGGKLSGGQRQRLSIARAVLKNPPILILDEATSALDTESEKLVQDALSNLMQNRTSIVIAHRLSTIANADEIIVLQQGQIAERGTHKELISQNGIYKKLCDMQSFK